MKNIIRLFANAILLASLLAGCSAGEPDIVTPEQHTLEFVSATETLAPTDTPPPTVTLVPTASPTLRPTHTPTIVPTATPAGYYENSASGFGIVAQRPWTVIEEDSQGSIMRNENTGQVLFVFSEPLSDEFSLVKHVEAIILTGFETTVALDAREIIPLIGGSETELITVKFDSEGESYVATAIAPQLGPKRFTFLIIEQARGFESRYPDLVSMLSSVQFVSGKLYDRDRSDSLVLMGFEPDPEDLDPALTLRGAYWYTGLLFSGLVQLSPTLNVAPDLAESWTINPDGTVYTFKLRPDATFSNGDQITAEDVKFSWERAAHPETGSSTAATYLGDIVGVKEVVSGESIEITGVRVVDKQTLEVTLDGPKPYFLIKLTYPTSFVVDQVDILIDPDGWMFNPNASGPYRLDEIFTEDALIFSRNDYYFQPAKIKNVIFLLYRPGTSLSYYEAGDIDFTSISEDDAEVFGSSEHPLNRELHEVTSLCTTYVQFNNTIPPFDDPMVRKAFALSIDRVAIDERFNNGRNHIADVVLPPAMPGFTPDLAPEPFNLDAAREALANSRYVDDMPKVIVIEAGYADSESHFLNAFISMWEEELGVEIEINYVDPRNFARELREAPGHINQSGWCADYPDPENFLDILFHSDSGFNFANYSNVEVDALLEAARTELDPARRIEIYQEVEALLLADYAVVPILEGRSFTLVKPNVGGWVDAPMDIPIFDLLFFDNE